MKIVASLIIFLTATNICLEVFHKPGKGQYQNDKKGRMKFIGIPLRKTGENEGKQQKTYKYNSKNFVSVDFPCVL